MGFLTVDMILPWRPRFRDLVLLCNGIVAHGQCPSAAFWMWRISAIGRETPRGLIRIH